MEGLHETGTRTRLLRVTADWDEIYSCRAELPQTPNRVLLYRPRAVNLS